MNRIMNVAEILQKLGSEAPAACMLIGGFALAEYGTPRETYDIDIALRRDDLTAFDRYVPFLSYRKIAETDYASRFRHARELPDLDLVYLEKSEFEALWETREQGVCGMQVIGREHWKELAFESCHSKSDSPVLTDGLGMRAWLAEYAVRFRSRFDPVGYVHFREECPLPAKR